MMREGHQELGNISVMSLSAVSLILLKDHNREIVKVFPDDSIR